MGKLVAHVKKAADGSWAEPHWLLDHLEGTAELASKFATAFDSATWGKVLGKLHDVGKGTPEWQAYLSMKSGYDAEAHLETIPGKLDHSGPSARIAEDLLGKGIGRILSYCISGHHAGLPDWFGDQSSLSYRLQNAKTGTIYPDVYEKGGNIALRPPREFTRNGIDLSLWIRMLFSCLVDADFLDTEMYFDPSKNEGRSLYRSIAELLDKINEYTSTLSARSNSTADSIINVARRQVLADCRRAASSAPGIFSLTVPTGGGKTLSSMTFALEHAKLHRMERVIYVIPYTSIIEQNADVFRKALGDDQVVEHHSNLDDDDTSIAARLAAENWDAPIIVTTAVQFFESLFASKASRCRKIHNIARSVIVLDEAQLVPVDFLSPIIQTLRILSEQYGSTVLLCTATQPVFEKTSTFPAFPGLPSGSVKEIVMDVPALYDALRRVEVAPVDLSEPRGWQSIAEELSELKQVLCIVSDRKSCRELYSLMPQGTYHLSALMCPQHRSDVISKIKDDLKSDKMVRVISTQLVEAGVDIDFPVVYRAIAGLDSIAQAAGRCNREGRLNASGMLGKVVVFRPTRRPPIGTLRKAADTAASMLAKGIDDPIDHSVFKPFFTELFWKANSLDKHEIEKLLRPREPECAIQFRAAAATFKLIDDKNQRTIIVPYREGAGHIALLRRLGQQRWILRKLQRYSVNIYLDQFTMLLRRGSLVEIAPELYALSTSLEYDEGMGLLLDEMPTDPEAFMAI